MTKKRLLYVVSIVLFVLTYLVYSWSKYMNVDFFAINGTYQNYNMIRRLLNGQVPYRDYSCYLGYGANILGAMFTFMLGGSFYVSQIAMQMLCVLFVWLVVFTLGKGILGENKKALLASVIVTEARMLAELCQDSISLPIMDALVDNISLSVGNSARLVRGIALPASVLAFWGLDWLTGKLCCKWKWGATNAGIMKLICASVAAGLAFIFSSDYGIASCVCITVMLIVAKLAETKNVYKTLISMLIYMVFTVVTVIAAVTVLTHGHLDVWLSNIAGNGSYQIWYYGRGKLSVCYIWDVDCNGIIILSLLLTLFYMVLMCVSIKDKDYALRRYGTPMFLNMTVYAAANEYRLLSNGSLHEVASAVVVVTVIVEMFNIGEKSVKAYFKLTKNKKRIGSEFLTVSFAAIIAFVLLVVQLLGNVDSYLEVKENSKYQIAVGGGYANGQMYNDIEDAKNLIGDAKVFSTYASALEVCLGQFQPSGTDYIIHVLGDEQREAYIQNFETGNYMFATTIREEYSNWEYWIRDANWFFYRELYAYYHPVYRNSYQVIWEKNEDDKNYVLNDNCEIEIVGNGTNFVTITVNCDENITGTAEILLDWNVEKTDRLLSLFTFKTTIHVDSKSEAELYDSDVCSYNLASEGRAYLPVWIVNGKGEITIESVPDANTLVYINEALPGNIYTVYSDYIPITNIYQDGEYCWFYIENEERFAAVLDSCQGLKFGNEEYSAEEILKDDDYIQVKVQEPNYSILLEQLETNNYVEIVVN